ncbi:testis-specific serine/threonine-protein kinase 6 [Cyclopterus lumpus]|uniref:testis-specific serine/threonine-protein kinase 6 n=1 Tax=Cyclopterus lumpus TaxID=8103 RepID=UPI0014873763|nr:testis-specific serine/threonine-protein kinase 6 [Cyclopterus lumpus]
MNKRFMESRGYTFNSILGEGTFGKVGSAYSTCLRTRVAIKVINKRKLTPNYRENFLARELEIIRSLDHPNIVKTLDIFESRTSKVYVVMEFCEKGDLLKHITVNGALPEHSVCRLFTQLCNGVQYLHNRDVAHRDLKCENILLDINLHLKVCDFGFSKRLTYADGRMMLSETFCGTSSYASPEILKGFPYNPKVSDVWSMGVVLYMMLLASMPYDSTNIKKMLDSQIKHIVIFPNIPSISSEVKALIQSILHPVVGQRITINNILQTSWMLQEVRMEDSDNATTSKAGSVEGPRDGEANVEDLPEAYSQPGQGPSTAAPRQ